MAESDAKVWPRFIHLPGFDRHWTRLELDDRALALLQAAIAADPGIGQVMEKSGGLRKMRFVGPDERRGKSGAYRVGYLSYPEFGVAVLVTVWGKKEKANLSAADLKAISKLAKDLHSQLKKGAT